MVIESIDSKPKQRLIPGDRHSQTVDQQEQPKEINHKPADNVVHGRHKEDP